MKEALKIYERINDTPGQARSWQTLAKLFYDDEQLDAAEEAAYRAIDLAADDDQYQVCGCYNHLGEIYHSKGEIEKAITHFEKSIGIATTFEIGRASCRERVLNLV